MGDDFLLRAADGFLNALQRALAAAQDETAQNEADLWSQRLIAQVRAFERAALQLCGDGPLVADASYLLCAMGDELMTERLGLGWTVVSLLVQHHGDVHGGQRSWARLDGLLHGSSMEASRENGTQDAERALLRLYERAIVLGIRGRHGLEPGGDQALERVRRQVADRLRPGSEHQPAMGDLVDLATRHLQSRRRWVGAAALGLTLLALLIVAIEIRRDVDARWNDAAQAMAKAAYVPGQQGGAGR